MTKTLKFTLVATAMLHSAVQAADVGQVTLSAAQAAEVEQVIVRQQWPWSTDVKVEYRLSGVNAASPVDIGVEVFDGDTALDTNNLHNAITGDRYGITKAVGSFTIDPIKAFGTSEAAYSNFRVRLTATPSPSNLDEALYKIFDLSDGSCTNVTRRDLLNGKWGTYETDYSRIDPNFTTGLDDVLIWTGVTNNIAYKTTHLVMRKIHAVNKVWQSGDPEGVTVGYFAAVPRYWVTLSYDYYIAVFETTQAQYKKIHGSFSGLNNSTCGFSDEEDSPCYPVNNTMRYNVFAHPNTSYNTYYGVLTKEPVIFPTNTYTREVGGQTTCAKMWTKTKVEFNLPTGAEWEFACRGGNDTPLYSGEAQTAANVSKIAWYNGNPGGKPHVVGSKAPNAYGLYDMLGNVAEHCNFVGQMNQGGKSGTGESESDPVVDPLGNPNPSPTVTYYTVGLPCFETDYNFGRWQDCRHATRSQSFEYYAYRNFLGFRFVMPARADGQWADHPTQQ